MTVISKQLRLLATALTFLTRLPGVARYADPSPHELARALPYFPLVGLMVGGIAAGVYLAAWLLFGQSMLASVWALIASVLATGAFHEDGFADSCDGLGGGMDRDRRLTIMRDSRIGSFAGVGIVLLTLLKLSTLSALSWTDAIAALLAAHVLARLSSLILAQQLPYVREGELKPIAEGMTGKRLLAGIGLSALALVPSILIAGAVPVLLAIALMMLAMPMARHRFQALIGGITGDTLGAFNQVTEALTLMAFVGAARLPVL